MVTLERFHMDPLVAHPQLIWEHLLPWLRPTDNHALAAGVAGMRRPSPGRTVSRGWPGRATIWAPSPVRIPRSGWAKGGLRMPMQPLRHSYTNDTRGDGKVVVKRYNGPDAVARRDRERTILTRLDGLVPVPALLDVDVSGELHLAFVAGVQGQELIEAGLVGPVLRACGHTLRQLHALDVGRVLPDGPHPAGAVLVHGDYGPNNVLLEPDASAVASVLDWEWAHSGDAVEDLAWCEWIVRMHHGQHVQMLVEFFDAYGWHPAWEQRQAAMLAQCQRLLDTCHRWNHDAVRTWQHRLEITAGWVEVP